MIMIIGGASQGKTDYAIRNYNASPGQLFYLNEAVEKLYLGGRDVGGFLKEKYDNESDLIVVTDEVGCGIIPIEKKEREQRDLIGEMQILTAKRADEVIRVICGIGQRIK